MQPERIPSTELQLTAVFVPAVLDLAVLNITLRNVSQRTLVFDTGYEGYPMANFGFSLETSGHQWLTLFCNRCMPGSFVMPTPNTIRLKPAQAQRFTVPLSAFVAADPRSGNRIEMQNLRGRMLIELQVPTPPHAQHSWPGYVSASVALP